MFLKALFTICLLYIFLLRFTHIGFMCEFEEKVGNKTLRIRSKTFNTSLVQNNAFELEDLQYGKSNNYVQMLDNNSQLKDLSNEKKCFHRLVPYEQNSKHITTCFSNTQVLWFFHQYKPDLLFRCQDSTLYSHCQEFYLFVFDSKNNICSSFQRKPCII